MLVGLGVDPWNALWRHPAALAVAGLVDEGYHVQWLCIHARVAAEVSGSHLGRRDEVRVFGPKKSAHWTHTAKKTAAILASLPATRSVAESRGRLSALTRDNAEARDAVRRWESRREGQPQALLLFGSNALSTELLRRVAGHRFLYIETGDYRLRLEPFTRLLERRRAIHLPLTEEDAPSGLPILPPVGFPVDEPFRRSRPPSVRSTVVRVGFAGRLHRVKGLEYLIDAVRLLRRRGTNAELHIAGEGPDRERLAAIAANSRWFTLRGGISDGRELRQFYADLDVYAVASAPNANEGLPVSMLEALLCGARVVATDVGAIRARLGDLVTIVPGSSPETLATGILEALRMPAASLDAIRSRIPTPREYARTLMSALVPDAE